jgi:hypothetical protein
VKPLDLRTTLRDSVLGSRGDPVTGESRARPGREGCLESFTTRVQDNGDRLNQLTEIQQ